MPLDVTQTQPETSRVLKAVKAKLGIIPNSFATLAHSPAALSGYLQLSDAVAGGRLSARQREIIALAVAQSNRCQYCLSAHTQVGKVVGLSEKEIAQARSGRGVDAFNAAIARFAFDLSENRGIISDAEFRAARDAGLDDELIVEVVVNVALNILTNYINHVAGTSIDFPVIDLEDSSAA
jgi:uncharacterized peroxidase-related enzyme